MSSPDRARVDQLQVGGSAPSRTHTSALRSTCSDLPNAPPTGEAVACTEETSIVDAGFLLMDFFEARRPNLAPQAREFWKIQDTVLNDALTEMFLTLHKPGITKEEFDTDRDFSDSMIRLCFDNLSGVHRTFREADQLEGGFEREPFRSGVRTALTKRLDHMDYLANNKQ